MDKKLTKQVIKSESKCKCCFTKAADLFSAAFCLRLIICTVNIKTYISVLE